MKFEESLLLGIGITAGISFLIYIIIKYKWGRKPRFLNKFSGKLSPDLNKLKVEFREVDDRIKTLRILNGFVINIRTLVHKSKNEFGALLHQFEQRKKIGEQDLQIIQEIDKEFSDILERFDNFLIDKSPSFNTSITDQANKIFTLGKSISELIKKFLKPGLSGINSTDQLKATKEKVDQLYTDIASYHKETNQLLHEFFEIKE